MKPIPAIVPAPATDAQPTGGRRPTVAEAAREPGRADDPDRLAEHVAEQDPERHAGRCRPSRGSWPLSWTPAFASAKSGTIA